MNIEHIVVLRNDALGDAVLTCPLLSQIKELWPQSSLSVIARDLTAPLLECHPSLDTVISDYKQQYNLPAAQKLAALVKELKKIKADAIFFPHMDPIYVWAAKLAGIPIRVGDKNQLLLSPLLTHKVDINWHNLRLHESAQQCQLLTPFSQQVSVMGLPFTVPEKARDSLYSILGKYRDKQWVLIHPGFGEGNRGWDVQAYAGLIDKIHEDPKYQVILTGTGSDSEASAVIAECAKTRPINMTNKTNLLELLALIDESVCVIGAETGPIHLAAYCKKPVLCISPTKFVKSFRWGPLGTNHIILKKNKQCPLVCHTYRRRCEKSHCIDTIQSEEAFQAFCFLVEQEQFPKMPFYYWFKTNATVALDVESCDAETLIYLDSIRTFLSDNGVSYVVTTRSKTCFEQLKERNETVIYFPAYRLDLWVQWAAVQDITIWHSVKERSSNAFLKTVSALVALKVYLPPRVVNSRAIVSSLKELIDLYTVHK